MKLKTNTHISYLLLYIITTTFFINRILTRFIYENATKYSWMIFTGIGFSIILLTPIILSLKKSKEPTYLLKLIIYLYFFSTSLLVLIFLLNLMNTYWLPKTRYLWLLIPFLSILYYLLSKKEKVFLRLITLFSFPIVIQYVIYICTPDKSINLYALIPYQTNLQNIPTLILISFHMILHPFIGILYLPESISKKEIYVSNFIIIFSLIFDGIIACGQFGKAIHFFPFVYYESWRLLHYDQYLPYLDTLSFFYWVISSFSYVGLSLQMIKTYTNHQIYVFTYLFLTLLLIFLLTNGSLFQTIIPYLSIFITCTLFFIVTTYQRKEDSQ